MTDLISREAAVNAVKALLMDGGNTPQIVWPSDVLGTLATVPAVDAVPKWIPFVVRALTDEEKALHPEWDFFLEGETPDDEEDILLCRPWKNKEGYIIELDTYCNNGDTVYMEGAGDIENGMYWMHLPKPPKGG